MLYPKNYQMSNSSPSYSFSNYSLFSISNHFGIYASLATLNGILSLLSLGRLIHFWVLCRHLLKKKMYRFYFLSLCLSFAGNFIAIFRAFVSRDMTTGHFQLILVSLNATSVAQFSILWLMFWNLVALYKVLDPWLERVMPAYLTMISIALGIESVLFFFAGFIITLIPNQLQDYLNVIHSLYLMFLGVVASVSSMILLIHVARLLETFHREKQKDRADNLGIRRLQQMILVCGVGLLLCCASFFPILFPSMFSLLFEICSLTAICLSIVSTLVIYTFDLTVSLALPSKKSKPKTALQKKIPNGNVEDPQKVKVEILQREVVVQSSLVADTVKVTQDQPTVLIGERLL